MDNSEILQLIFYCDDIGANISIKNYFKKLLNALWLEADGFSGKRPLGNSGWQYDVYRVLIQHNVIKGELDEDGFVENIDINNADKKILELIASI